MRCPFCSFLEDKVVDSRIVSDGRAIRRRRQCEECSKRYTTYEKIEESTPIIVKKDGRRETYDRTKVLTGLMSACEKRPIPVKILEDFADSLEVRLMETGTSETDATKIGEAASEFLKDIDPIAYIRFASVYRSFSELQEFIDEIQEYKEHEK